MGQPFQLGRYSLHAELASGGMATVYLARQTGAVGFGKTVAIKRLHPHLARDPYFVTMFLDEARLCARVQHPNVVPILDVVSADRELFLVMEYVRGETLSGLLRVLRKSNAFVPVPVAASIVVGLLAGLHAAHEATDEHGKPLSIVHRDVSPQNVIVGADGVARVLDFGVAKAATRLQTTREGQLKGKIPYMAPEQLSGEVSKRTDVYAAGVVLWEALTSKRLFQGVTEAQMLHLVMTAKVEAPSTINPEVPPEVDRVVLKALQRNAEDRYPSARAMASDLESALAPASAIKVAEWMQGLIGPTLAARVAAVSDIESNPSAAELSAPSSLPTSPSLPMLPGADESSPFEPSSATHSSPSTASLVMKTPAPPPKRPVWPFVVAAVAVAGSIAVVIGMRVTPKPASATPAPAETPSVLATTSTSATSIPPTPVSASASPAESAPVAKPLGAATHHFTKPAATNTTVTPTASATAQDKPSDIKSLLDTR